MQNIFLTIILVLVVSGCSNSSTEKTTLNELNSKISIKELTTGVRIDKIKMPKPYLVTDKKIMLDFNYFGKKRTTAIDLTSNKVIHTIDIQLDSSEAFDLARSLKEKYANEGNKDFSFKCGNSNNDLGGIKITNYTCTAYHGSQILSIIHRSIDDRNIPFNVVSQLTYGTLLLKDTAVEAEQLKNEQEKRRSEHDKQLKKSQSDI